MYRAPQRLRNVGTGSSGAFLTCKFEGALDEGSRERIHICSGMSKDEVLRVVRDRGGGESECLATSLADNARIVFVDVDVIRDLIVNQELRGKKERYLLPKRFENGCGTSVMQTSHVRRCEYLLRDHLRGAW